MERHLGDAFFVLEEKTRTFESNESIRFLVSLETTLRQSTFMQIDFGNGDVRNISLRERNNVTDAEMLINNLDFLMLVASYGEGCCLTVEFQYRYQHQGIFMPSIMFGDLTDSLTQLDEEIIVLNRLVGPRIQAEKTTEINISTQFSLHFATSSFNLTVIWSLTKSDGKIIDQIESEFPQFFYTFTQEGMYAIHANASNAINMVYTSTNILVQVPVSTIMLSCEPTHFLVIGSQISCQAEIQHGSSVSFVWSFGDNYRSTVIDNFALKSYSNHTYYRPQNYQIKVSATNAISREIKTFNRLIAVEVPIRQVMLIHGSPTVLGSSTDVFAKTNDFLDNAIDAIFEFNFGNGRQYYDGVLEKGKIFYNFTFEEAGVFDVCVFAFNNVSEVNTTVTVYIEEPLIEVGAEVMDPCVVYLDSVFILMLKDKLSSRNDVIYEWTFDNTGRNISKSPVQNNKYSSPGLHTLNYTIKNQVGCVAGQLEFEIQESLSTPKPIHNAIVAVGEEVSFRIVGARDWWKLFVDYSDGDNEMYRSPIDSWKHTFSATGFYQLAFSIFGNKGNRTTVRSYINVEEPIRDLYLLGPSAVEIKRLHQDESWRAVTGSGSHILYTWSINNEIQNETTVNRFFKSFEFPASHVICVRARNDISEATACLKIAVQYPVFAVEVSLSSAIAGIFTNITLQVHGGRRFFIECNFGDGSTTTISSEASKLAIQTIEEGKGRQKLPMYEMTVSHLYKSEGQYVLNVNVSNLISHFNSEKVVTVEEPIAGIELFTDSPRVISLAYPDVNVRATVQSGKDLKFTWDFGDFDDGYFTKVTSHDNTSRATHKYNLAEEYTVKVIVSNPRYPFPVVSLLPLTFLVVEDVENVFLRHLPVNNEMKNGAALRNYYGLITTDEVIFEASVEKGSHMTFIFDFGDGSIQTSYREFLSNPMMHLIKAKHRYQNVGVYNVVLTVSNPLGNLTVALNGLFYVQIPPEGIILKSENFCTLPREDVHLKLEVALGTNLTIDWMMGDETEFINHGNTVLHQYQITGTKIMKVIIYNKVHKVILPREITVVDEIQGLTLNVPDEVIVAGVSYKYTVTPRPSIMGIVQYYAWDSNETMPHGLKITKDPHNSFKLPSGKHIITVTAKNCLSSAMSNPVSVHAVAKLVHLTISAASNKLVGQAVEFQAMFWEGDYLNFTWQFGDDTDDVVIRDRLNINHTYHRVGEYIVTLTATNPISLMTTSLKVFILNTICNPPDVRIVSQIHGQKQLTFLRSEVIHVEAKVKVNECQITSVVFYSWMLIDTATNRQLYIRPHDDQSLKQLSLILPPRSIEYGHYTVKLKVKMINTIVYSVSETDIIIKKSPLIITIDGGNLRIFNHKDILHLDGSQSEDPDKLDQSELMFQWSCIILNYLNSSCFKDVKWPPNIPSNMSTVVMPTRLLLKEKTDFMFNLTVTTPLGRSGFTDQVIKILRVDKVLSIKLKCKQCIGQLANPNYQLSFETSCPGCLPSQTMYKWEVKLVHGKQHAPSAVHDFGQCVQPDGSSYVSLSSQKLGTTPEPKREVVTQSTSRKISKTTSTASLPMLGPFMMNEGSSGRGRQRFGRGGIPETRISKGLRSPPELPYRGSDKDLKERLPFPGRPRLRNLPRQHDSSNILTMPVLGEGSPGESGSSQGRIMGTSINEPIEQPGNARQFPDESSHMASKEDEDEDTLVGRPRPRNETKHVISQDSSTVRLLPEQTRTGLVKQSLVINPGVLMQGRTYVVKVTAHSLDNSSGVAMAYFKVNESPQKGLCEVSKDRSGIEVETIFRVFCREWKDEHMPLEFEVSYNLYKGDRKKLLYRGLSHEINFQLPAGNSTDGDRVYLHIGILDGIRARTSVCPIPIVVRRKPVAFDNSSDDAVLQHNEELQKSVQQGDSRTACILIDYLAKQLNRFTLPHLQRIRQDTRWELLNLLSAFPKRDEVEILQVAESLVTTTAVPSELKNRSLTKALEVLKSINVETEALYAIKNAGIPDLLTLAVQAVSNIMQAVLQFPPNRGLKWLTDEALSVVNSLIKLELQYHCIGEEPIQRMAEFVSVLASHFSTGQKQRIHINDASFIIPPNIQFVAEQPANHQCYQAHMTTFKRNPYGYDVRESSKVQSRIVSLDLYNCEGKEHHIENLDDDNLVEIWIPRNNVNNKNSSQHVLKRNVMNIHQFNITNDNMVLSLFITLDLNKIKNGRPFPISALIGQHNPPTPELYYYKKELDKHADHIKLFLPSGSFNATGMYYLGVVDADYNAGRRRPGELVDRSYSLLLWWGGCFYWDTHTEHWSSAGCTITKQSTSEKSHCRCNHLTAFGGHFDLFANNLSFTNVDEFFGLNENPVVIILVVVILCIYSGLMVVCHKADLHDIRKCGLISLKDNRSTDKHKYEITVETGYRQGAGTTAKISFILHGEEGMSETRELICDDDDRVLFEQNSRDIFIMSLPDTLGRLFKVQLWHNNHGPSPSWYLSRVTIKDLSTDKMFYFLCEKWFAVEEDDGKVEREIMVLDSELGFSRVFWAKGTQYVADFHMWLSPYTCPPYSKYSRIERLTCCLTAIMSYMCLNAVWYQSKQEYRGEFGLLDLSLRNITVGVICSCIILPLSLFIAFLFRRSKIRYPGPEPDKVYPSGKQNGEQISETDEESVQPVMTYSILDQSILNWQGIQDWAQKQWLKRQLSVRSNTDSAKSRPTTQNRQTGGESERDPNSPTTELTSTSIVSPTTELTSKSIVSPTTELTSTSIVSPTTELTSTSIISPTTELTSTSIVSPTTELTSTSIVSPTTELTSTSIVSPTTELTSTSIVSPTRQKELPNAPTIETKKHSPLDIPAPTGRMSHSPQSSPPSPHHPHPPPYSWNLSQGPLYSPRYLPLCQANANTVTGRNLSINHDLPVLHVPVLQNIRHGYDTDLASSGFVDATSQSQATAERTRIKLVSETSSSGRQSNTEYVDNGRGWRLFLVFWCRYVAWFLCISICVTCAIITVLYGFRFGYNKSIQWLQSLYFTFMVCVFVTQPLLILIVVLYTALWYRNNPAILNHHNDGYYGVRYDPRKMLDEGKAECCRPGEELEQGVAARQRSRYLRFARPPHEKTLIEARKKIIKEKRAVDLIRCSIVQILLVLCVGAIAYGKDGQTAFNLNTAISKIFLKSGNQYFHSIKSVSDFYSWCHTSFLDNLYDIKTPTSRPEGRFGLRNSVLIGSANLRQLRVKEEACLNEFAFPINVFPGISNCRYSYTQQHKSTLSFGPNSSWTWLPSTGGITLWGKYGFYDNSGFVTELKDSRDLAGKQINQLESSNWIDKQTRAVIIEFTIYYIPGNLFSCVSLLVETPESGGVFVKPFIASTYLFRYLSAWDNFILAFELLFFVISLHQIKCELVAMVKKRKEYFTSFWCIIEMLMCVFSLVYIGCYIYRYILISDAVEHLRNTYYQQFINISFICCWNELLQTLIGCVLFLLCVQLVRLLNRNAWCVKAANFYKKSQRELSLFMLLFGVLVMAFSSAGVVLFGTACEGVQGVWTSMFTMVMTLTGVYPERDINQSQWSHLFMLVYVVFTTGLLSAYILAVMNRRVKTEKSSDLQQMNGVDCVCFLWDKFLTKLGVRQIEKPEEPNNILPAEFIMAEIEYQVDELLFRMNALSGSSALPDKPRAYFTDSDTTHNVGDDGISTGGSEHDHGENGRLGQRVQRIENKLYANEPYLAQLLKLDSVGADILSQEKEKQLRSHLELEIFRQLQLQRQEINDTDEPLLLTTITDNSGHNTEQSNATSTPDSHNLLDKTWIPADLTDLENLLKLREAMPKSSSSSPDSTHDTRVKNQQSYSEQIKNCIKAALQEAKKTKQSSSSDNVSPQSSESDKAHVRTDSSSGQSSNTGSLTKQSPQSSQNRKGDKTKCSNLETPKAHLKPASSISTPKSVPKINPAIPPKPSFIKNLTDSKHSKCSPKLRHLHLVPESASIKDGVVQMAESSSGSEQDAGHSLKRTSGKRALRKTRSQGRGKGHLLDLETDVFGEEEEAEIDDET